MASATFPPKINNGLLNSEFNSSDFVVSQNDLRYLKLTGGTLTGSLAVNNSTTTNGLTSLSGTNQFNTNISLPTTYTASPNTTFPTSTQLGGILTASQTGSLATTGTVAAITSLALGVGVWMVSWRGCIFPTASGNGTYTAFRLVLNTTSGSIDAVNNTQQVQICPSQTATNGAAVGNDISLMGSSIIQVSANNTSYYLNGQCNFTSTQPSYWRGHIHAVRIA